MLIKKNHRINTTEVIPYIKNSIIFKVTNARIVQVIIKKMHYIIFNKIKEKKNEN